jgi:hypothetical protein
MIMTIAAKIRSYLTYKPAIALSPWRDSQSMLQLAQISNFRDARNQQSEIAGILGSTR